MRTALIVAAVAAVYLALTGCGDADVDGFATASSAPSELSTQELASIRAEAGLPPDPEPHVRTAYIGRLDSLDRDIAHGEHEKAVDRGLNQCSSIKHHGNDRDRLIDLTNQRFTSPSHPEGHGTATAEKILDIVHKHLCPDF